MKRNKRFLFYGLSSLLLLLVLELCLRGYYASALECPNAWLRPRALLETYYPGIDSAMNTPVRPNNGQIDVLMLGGSVLHPRWGSIEAGLKTRLEAEFDQPVVMWNLSKESHTSGGQLLNRSSLMPWYSSTTS